MRPITFSLFFCCVPPVSSQYWLYSFADTDWELEARHRIRWYGSEDGFEESQLTCLREKTWWSRSCSLSNSVYQRSEEVTFSSYFPVPPSAEIPSSSLTFVFLSSGVFEEKNIENFPLLICWPDASSYCRSIFFSDLQHSSEAWQKIIVSSAKSRWFTRGLRLATLIPCNVPSLRSDWS